MLDEIKFYCHNCGNLMQSASECQCCGRRNGVNCAGTTKVDNKPSHEEIISMINAMCHSNDTVEKPKHSASLKFFEVTAGIVTWLAISAVTFVFLFFVAVVFLAIYRNV